MLIFYTEVELVEEGQLLQLHLWGGGRRGKVWGRTRKMSVGHEPSSHILTVMIEKFFIKTVTDSTGATRVNKTNGLSWFKTFNNLFRYTDCVYTHQRDRSINRRVVCHYILRWSQQADSFCTCRIEISDGLDLQRKKNDFLTPLHLFNTLTYLM